MRGRKRGGGWETGREGRSRTQKKNGSIERDRTKDQEFPAKITLGRKKDRTRKGKLEKTKVPGFKKGGVRGFIPRRGGRGG